MARLDELEMFNGDNYVPDQKSILYAAPVISAGGGEICFSYFFKGIKLLFSLTIIFLIKNQFCTLPRYFLKE